MFMVSPLTHLLIPFTADLLATLRMQLAKLVQPLTLPHLYEELIQRWIPPISWFWNKSGHFGLAGEATLYPARSIKIKEVDGFRIQEGRHFLLHWRKLTKMHVCRIIGVDT